MMGYLHQTRQSAVTALCMKRLQIMIEEDLDAALERQAALDGVSKAAIIRRIVRAELPTTLPLAADPLSRMVAADSFEPDDIDDVV